MEDGKGILNGWVLRYGDVPYKTMFLKLLNTIIFQTAGIHP